MVLEHLKYCKMGKQTEEKRIQTSKNTTTTKIERTPSASGLAFEGESTHRAV